MNRSNGDRRLLQARLLWLGAAMIGLLGLLVTRLVYLQVLEHDRYAGFSQSNRIETLPLEPVRGSIFDRNGTVLARSVSVFNLEVDARVIGVRAAPEFLDEIGRWVVLSEVERERFLERLRAPGRFNWVTLKSALEGEEVDRLAVNLDRYPGVQIVARLRRDYPNADGLAHLIGYLGRISAEELKRVEVADYRGLQHIGKIGLERQYEALLRGQPGSQEVEINAHGRIVRVLNQTPPNAGRHLHLTLDLPLQRRAMEELAAYEGAAVALDPKTGAVLALVSSPGYDPNLFVGGISHQEYATLRDNPNRPLLHRATTGVYAPGSTLKGLMLLAGLARGYSAKEPVFCPGWFSLPDHSHRYRDWLRSGHGWVDGGRAIVESCDPYFYDLAHKLGIEGMHQALGRYGVGNVTGIDLPGERSGLMPSPDWKRRVHDQPWYPGETIIAGIGQGFMLATPLQLATLTASLANGGYKIEPHLLAALEEPATRTRVVPERPPVSDKPLYPADHLAIVVRAMRDVVHGERGTARGISGGLRYRIAGKTGTAQVKSIAQGEEYDEENLPKEYIDHSLFIAFAPIKKPQIAIAVVVEHAGSGARVAAPIARRLLDFYLLERLGLFAGSGAPATGDNSAGGDS